MNVNSTYLKATDQVHTHKVDSMAASIIFMTGSTGFIGKEAVKQLVDENLQLLLLVRSESKARQGLTSYGVSQNHVCTRRLIGGGTWSYCSRS